MTDQHPITPPPELVQQWEENWHHSKSNIELELYMAAQASQWGYDQRGKVNEAELQEARDEELEACCEWLRHTYGYGFDLDLKLRAARRPKPPSLKKQALEDLDQIDGHAVDQLSAYLIHDDLKQRVSNIRRALEALPDD